MGEFPKVSYEPSEKKRFEISKDEYSRERLETIKTFYEKMQHSFGIPMGVALSGSLAKGKELDAEKKDASDVDFTFYIDFDEYKQKYIENLGRNKDFLDFESRRLDGVCHNSSDRKLLDESVQKLRNKEDLSLDEKEFLEKRLQNFNMDQFLFFLTVWHGYADFSDSEGISQDFSFRGKSRYPIERMNHLLRIKDVQVWPIQFEGEFSIKSQVERVKKLRENIGDVEDNQREYAVGRLDQERYGIARIFWLDIGGGMKLYRQAFIRELLLLPSEEGEKLWNVVNESVRIRERDNAIPEHMEKQFPKTLQEAARYYSI
ncbi:MAG: hypothetical protein KC736_01935 [Candidatus Moranbacteria bacterium]|nr:hypothetical protein [Candidatus Moranbacteria bacterium]